MSTHSTSRYGFLSLVIAGIAFFGCPLTRAGGNTQTVLEVPVMVTGESWPTETRPEIRLTQNLDSYELEPHSQMSYNGLSEYFATKPGEKSSVTVNLELSAGTAVVAEKTEDRKKIETLSVENLPFRLEGVEGRLENTPKGVVVTLLSGSVTVSSAGPRLVANDGGSAAVFTRGDDGRILVQPFPTNRDDLKTLRAQIAILETAKPQRYLEPQSDTQSFLQKAITSLQVSPILVWFPLGAFLVSAVGLLFGKSRRLFPWAWYAIVWLMTCMAFLYAIDTGTGSLGIKIWLTGGGIAFGALSWARKGFAEKDARLGFSMLVGGVCALESLFLLPGILGFLNRFIGPRFDEVWPALMNAAAWLSMKTAEAKPSTFQSTTAEPAIVAISLCIGAWISWSQWRVLRVRKEGSHYRGAIWCLRWTTLCAFMGLPMLLNLWAADAQPGDYKTVLKWVGVTLGTTVFFLMPFFAWNKRPREDSFQPIVSKGGAGLVIAAGTYASLALAVACVGISVAWRSADELVSLRELQGAFVQDYVRQAIEHAGGKLAFDNGRGLTGPSWGEVKSMVKQAGADTDELNLGLDELRGFRCFAVDPARVLPLPKGYQLPSEAFSHRGVVMQITDRTSEKAWIGWSNVDEWRPETRSAVYTLLETKDGGDETVVGADRKLFAEYFLRAESKARATTVQIPGLRLEFSAEMGVYASFFFEWLLLEFLADRLLRLVATNFWPRPNWLILDSGQRSVRFIAWLWQIALLASPVALFAAATSRLNLASALAGVGDSLGLDTWKLLLIVVMLCLLNGVFWRLVGAFAQLREYYGAKQPPAEPAQPVTLDAAGEQSEAESDGTFGEEEEGGAED